MVSLTATLFSAKSIYLNEHEDVASADKCKQIAQC